MVGRDATVQMLVETKDVEGLAWVVEVVGSEACLSGVRRSELETEPSDWLSSGSKSQSYLRTKMECVDWDEAMLAMTLLLAPIDGICLQRCSNANLVVIALHVFGRIPSLFGGSPYAEAPGWREGSK